MEVKIGSKGIPHRKMRLKLLELSVRVCLLTDIGGAFRYGQIGASAPCPALVIPLAAATVGPGGVVFTLAAQLLFVEHTTIGMKVALAPMKDRGKEEQVVHMREYYPAEDIKIPKTQQLFCDSQCDCQWSLE